MLLDDLALILLELFLDHFLCLVNGGIHIIAALFAADHASLGGNCHLHDMPPVIDFKSDMRSGVLGKEFLKFAELVLHRFFQ